jgi:hypothetical protein
MQQPDRLASACCMLVVQLKFAMLLNEEYHAHHSMTNLKTACTDQHWETLIGWRPKLEVTRH